jgi:hypothetical protein
MRERCAELASAVVRGGALLLVIALTVPVALAQNRSATAAEIANALKVLDRWQGRWNVTVTTTQPAPLTSTSVATNAWVLGKRFLQGDSGVKSDGTRDLSMMTFDPVTRAYPLWIFSSNGTFFYLADGKWDEQSRTMQWDSPINLIGSYHYLCEFTDADNYRCQSLAKDWKGKVLLELEAVGVRLR